MKRFALYKLWLPVASYGSRSSNQVILFYFVTIKSSSNLFVTSSTTTEIYEKSNTKAAD